MSPQDTVERVLKDIHVMFSKCESYEGRPDQVIVVAGMNKVAGDLEGAMRRAREVAAPVNAQRFAGLKTPCSVTGLCADCTGPDSICCQIVTTRICRPAGRIKVVLVGEELGF